MGDIYIIRGSPAVGKTAACKVLYQLLKEQQARPRRRWTGRLFGSQTDCYYISGDMFWVANGFHDHPGCSGTMIQNAFLEDAGAEIKKQALRYKTVIFDRLLSKQEDVQRLLDQLGNTSAVHIVRLWSPLELCIERNKRRRPRCEEEGLRKIWEETEPYPGELVIDTSQHSPREVANLIVQKVKAEFAFA